MKLPRWLVIGMLTTSVLAVLAAAGWWWVTWPERTAREFVQLLAMGKRDEAKRMVQSQDPMAALLACFLDCHDVWEWNQSNIQAESRTAWDIIAGRQRIQILYGRHIVVVRGSIPIAEPDWTTLSVEEAIKYESAKASRPDLLDKKLVIDEGLK